MSDATIQPAESIGSTLHKLKRQLEHELFDVINRFEETTHLSVTGIEVTQVSQANRRHVFRLEITVDA